MVKRLDKLRCSQCETEHWVELKDAAVCNCPQCGGTKHEKVDEWEVKPPSVAVQQPSVGFTHYQPSHMIEICSTSSMLDLEGMP